MFVGSRRDRIVMNTSLYPDSPRGIVHDLLFHHDPYAPRFPLVVERTKTRIPIEGRERIFTSCSFNTAPRRRRRYAGATSRWSARTRLLSTVRLGLLEPDRFREMMREKPRDD
jgi:hypothetical protein